MRFLLALLVAVFSVARVNAGCDSITNEKSCMTSTYDGVKCSWCNSAAVGATCFAETDAKGLPSSVFKCEYQSLYGAAEVTCDANKSESACMSSTSSSGEKCSWCNSAAVGATCFGESDAKGLPSSIFQCEYQKVPLKSTSCDTITSEKTCMDSNSNGEKCSWCNSAAVGGTCFVESDAKSLPSSVFQCEYQKAIFKATSCDGITTEKSCLDGKCAWCKSAAVGSTCFAEEDAKTLPTSIFQCEFPAAYAKGLRGN